MNKGNGTFRTFTLLQQSVDFMGCQVVATFEFVATNCLYLVIIYRPPLLTEPRARQHRRPLCLHLFRFLCHFLARHRPQFYSCRSRWSTASFATLPRSIFTFNVDSQILQIVMSSKMHSMWKKWPQSRNTFHRGLSLLHSSKSHFLWYKTVKLRNKLLLLYFLLYNIICELPNEYFYNKGILKIFLNPYLIFLGMLLNIVLSY